MTISELVRRQRDRELAGDERAGSWSRQKALRLQLAHIKRFGWRYSTASAAMMIAPVAIALLLPIPSFVRGLITGATLIGIPSLIWSHVVHATGTAPQMMGDQAEQWTAQELRRLRRRGWRLLNHFALADRDIDHLLVGSEQVFVVETKWSADWSGSWSAARLEEAMHQSRANARSLRLWQPLKVAAVEVRPLVVLWGGGLDRIALEETASPDVTMLRGRDLATWSGALGAAGPRTQHADGIWDQLVHQVESRDHFERQAGAVLTSPTRVLTEAYWTALVALAGFMTVVEVSYWTKNLAGGAAVGLGVFALLGVFATRGLWPRVLWTGAAAAGVPAVLLLAVELLYVIS